MHYTRLYSDEQGDSRFERVEIPLQDGGLIGFLSDRYPVKNMIFRQNPADYDWDFHHAPKRQFIVLIDGAIEITTSLGERRQFQAGDVLFVEDTTGKGHRTRNLIQEPRHSIFIEL